MQLEQLRYANEIAKCGSITQAAKNLFVSQPSLTIAIQKLESDLGFALFTRSSKGIQITPKGKEALVTIQQILNLTEVLINMSPNKEDSLTKITLPVFPTLFDLLDESIYAKIHTQHPNLTCEIIEQTANTILQEIQNGAISYAISGCPSTVFDIINVSKKSSNSNNLSTKILYEEPLLLLMSINNPLSKKDLLHIEDLRSETFLYYGEHLSNKQPNILEGYKFYFNEILPFYRRTSIMKAIAMGQGVSIMPKSQFQNDPNILKNKIRYCTIENFSNTFVHFLIYNKRHVFTQMEKDVLNIIENFYATL